PVEGALALVEDRGVHVLVASLDRGAYSADLAIVSRAVAIVFAPDAVCITIPTESERRAAEAAERWLTERTAARLAHAGNPVARDLRPLLRRLEALVSRAPPHRRPSLAALARDLRRLTLAVRGRGAE